MLNENKYKITYNEIPKSIGITTYNEIPKSIGITTYLYTHIVQIYSVLLY